MRTKFTGATLFRNFNILQPSALCATFQFSLLTLIFHYSRYNTCIATCMLENAMYL